MQQKYYNKKHHFREFYKGDFILLNVKNLQTIKPSKKLSHKYIRPFHIKKPIKTQIYHLSLSTSYWIHPVFHISLLKSYESRDGEMETHISESITVDEHKKYEIEKIFNKKNTKGELWYKVKWLKWSQKYNQWIIYKNLESASELQNAYNKQHKHSEETKDKKRWKHFFSKFFPKDFFRFLLRLHWIRKERKRKGNLIY